ncbi:MAG: DUF2341 domain-containing protein, partial [Candidatus Nanoarchaeia archaeon]
MATTSKLKSFFLLLAAFCAQMFFAQAAFAQFDPSNWNYDKTFFVNNPNPNDLTDYQVSFNLTYDTRMQLDFSDIRFTDFNGYEIPYWIEEKQDGSWAKVWLKIPFMPANNITNFTCYFGNKTPVSSASNGNAVFEFFDDFNDSILNTSKWTGDVQATELNGVLRIQQNYTTSGNYPHAIYSIRNNFSDYVMETRARSLGGADICPHLLLKWRYSGTGNLNDAGFRSCGKNDIYFYDGQERANVGAEPIAPNTFYFMQLILNGNSISFYVKNLQTGNSASTSYTGISTTLGSVGMTTWTYNNIAEFDYILVRKYAPIEPKVLESMPTCVIPPTGLVYWWPGDGNAKDIRSNNHGLIYNITYVPGKIDQAFNFSSNSYFSSINNLTISGNQPRTIEFWAKPLFLNQNYLHNVVFWGDLQLRIAGLYWQIVRYNTYNVFPAIDNEWQHI